MIMKIAILGLGFMGEKHKKVLSGFSEIEISALIDSKYKTQEQFYHSLEVGAWRAAWIWQDAISSYGWRTESDWTADGI